MSHHDEQFRMSKNNNQFHHVVVMAFPFGSHATAILNPVRRLAMAAPTVTFSFFSTAKSNTSIFGSPSLLSSNNSNKPAAYYNNDVLLSNLKAYDVDDGVPEDYKLTTTSGNPADQILEIIDLFIKSMAENFRKAIDDVVEGVGPASCVISDAFLWFAGEMAEEEMGGVPWISFWGGDASSLSTHFYTDFIRQSLNLGENGIVGREEELINFTPGLSTIRIKDLQEGIVVGDLESSFSCMLHRMGQMFPRATAIILNSFEDLNLPVLDDLKSKLPNKFLNVGPLILSSTRSSSPSELDANGCLPWLDGQKPTSVAYVSFGRVASPPPHELVALAEGLEETGTPFLWSLKDHLKVHLPKGFLERTSGRGFVVPWAPQREVLEHVAIGVFVTHCGWNSVLESIIAGVPMIGRPVFGDHMINCRMISEVWEIGIEMKDRIFTKYGMMEGLDLIFCSGKGKKLREKCGALRGLAKHVISPNGSSSKNFNTLLEVISNGLNNKKA
ncbi:UDP-glucuronosyl/UDP-glucosyltransferase [Macleaya cordata]|uniref:Glycosyltransferase n=1 Tax=Macleaya cordata TaxID=56857 RepID=A0A200RE36_MACCD|nr:UDP-glucuronosyl/UDP-glucosyltransferase [Macleaya cordata]